MKPVYIGLGSNSGDRIKNIRKALSQLSKEAAVELLRVSSYYLTAPQGYENQAWFINAVAETETSLPPAELLELLQSIEARMGRRRLFRWGPRNIDLDILFFGSQRVDETNLIIPHPRAQDRRFVMEPLAELCPAGVDPVTNKTFSALLKALGDDQPVVRLGTGLRDDGELAASIAERDRA